MQPKTPKLAAMMKKPLLLLVISMAACGMASADVLDVSVSGQFSSADIAGPLVAPNGLFSLTFGVDSNPTPLPGTVTSLSFDVPVEDFSYVLNNSPVNVTPSEITFSTLANGGLFAVNFGSGFTESSFVFEGDQAFSGTTAAPTFAQGNFAISDWTYSDANGNFDMESPVSGTVAVTPEPSTTFLVCCCLAAVTGWKFRKTLIK
jgi:hypothetical protein